MRRAATHVLIVTSLQLLIFVPMAMLRTVDADEGFYLVASRLVVEGRVPYSDFLYTQTPLLPYVYGLWMNVFGINWYVARLLSALLATALGTTLFAALERRYASRQLAWLGLVLYATSAFALAWNTVAMTYALSGLLLFLAFVCLDAPPSFLGKRFILVSGVLLGLAIDTRSLLVGAVPAFALVLWRWHARNRPPFAVFQWSIGLVAGVSPSLFFLVRDTNAFIFGNVGFHALRNGIGLIANWPQKAAILLELLNIHSSGGETITYQVPLLLPLGIYYFVLVVRRQAPLSIPLLATICISFVLLLPTPTYTQYFVVLLPFVIIIALDAFHFSRPRFDIGRNAAVRQRVRAAVGVFLALYSLALPVVFHRYTSWSVPMFAARQSVDTSAWSLPGIRSASAAIDTLVRPGDEVMTWWPGYLLETHASPLRGTENHGWMEVDGAAQPPRPIVASPESVHEAIARHEPKLLALGILSQAGYLEFAEANGYAPIERVGSVDLLER